MVRGVQRELEGLAREVRRRAGLNDDELALAPTIAERVLGRPIRIVPSLSTAACISFEDGRARILLREVRPDSNFDIAHELGHYALREIAGYSGADEERYANQIAAAMLAPSEVVRAVRRRHGGGLRPIRPLACATLISQTSAQLRLGEVLEDERAVVTKNGNVLVRSQGAFPWADVPIIDVARGGQYRGLAKAKLRGGIDEGRVALRAR